MTAMIAPYRIDGHLGALDRLVREVNGREKPDATIVLAHEVPLKVSPGLDPEQVAQSAWAPGKIGHYLEIHAEQGPVLEVFGAAALTVVSVGYALWIIKTTKE